MEYVKRAVDNPKIIIAVVIAVFYSAIASLMLIGG